MSLKKLTRFGGYEQINGGAHRKAASIVGVPALVRHIAFWNTHDPELGELLTNEERKKSYSDYVDRLENFIRTHRIKHCLLEETARLIKADPSEDSSAVSLIKFRWMGILATVRIEFHFEFITVTSILDFSVELMAEDLSGEEVNHQKRVSSALKDLKTIFSSEQESAGRRALAQTVADYLQFEIWADFEKSVIDAPIGEATLLGEALGRVFVDLRGVVTGSYLDPKSKTQDDLKNARYHLREPFKFSLPRERSREMQHDAPPEGWHRRTLRRLWPLLESPSYLKDFEFSVSAMLDHRVLFTTAAGPQLTEEMAEGAGPDWRPICYHIHSYTDDEWQIGRLVDRLNMMGTLRLAATIDIDGLRRAGSLIQRLSRAIGDASTVIDKTIQAVSDFPRGEEAGKYLGSAANRPTTPDMGVAGPGKASQNRQTPNGAMTRVSRLLTVINGRVSGDISYRLERAQYYVSRFDIEAKALRTRRVEGFVPYEEFVTRRMSPIFSYIDLLQARMRDIRADMSRLSGHYSSLKIAEVTQGIERRNDEIRRMQDFGEYALIGVLIPYYLGTVVIEHAMGMHESPGPAVWLSLLSLCLLIITIRVIVRTAKKEMDWRTSSAAVLAVLLFLGFVWSGWGGLFGGFSVSHIESKEIPEQRVPSVSDNLHQHEQAETDNGNQGNAE